MASRLAGKSALVTGASAGIGRASALALAREGASIVAAGRRVPELETLVAEIATAGGEARYLAGDLDREEFLVSLAREAGAVDIFLNNAGILVYAPFLELPPADLEAMMRTNLVSGLRLTQLIAAGMVERGRGHIIYITSGAARRAVPLGLVYSATKAALSAAARTLRVELQDKGIKVSEIAPGTVDTEIRKNSHHPAYLAKMKARKFDPLSAEDVDRAVKAAAHTFAKTPWAKMPANERGVLLHRLADAVEKHKPIIGQIESLDAGKILGQALGDVQNCVDTLRYFTDMAQHVQRRNVLAVAGHEAWTTRSPWGACGFIFPWNFPLLLIGWGISPALAAGNTVVIKPAEDTPLSAIYLARLAREVGLPDGVINVVTGTGAGAGAAVSGHPGLKRMSFTGSPEVGRLVGEACGRNLVPVKLELGGKGAAVVFDDVDVAATAAKLVGAITFHTGQVCCDATRWLVHDTIYDRFVDECRTRMGQVHVGHQLEVGLAEVLHGDVPVVAQCTHDLAEVAELPVRHLS